MAAPVATPTPGVSPTSNRVAWRSKPRLREAMDRMRGVLQRVETRVLAEADTAGMVHAWLFGGALLVAALVAFMLWAIARSIQQSIHAVGEVAQALAAGDMDNRCEPHGSDEVSALARMINLLADTMQGMLTRLRIRGRAAAASATSWSKRWKWRTRKPRPIA